MVTASHSVMSADGPCDVNRRARLIIFGTLRAKLFRSFHPMHKISVAHGIQRFIAVLGIVPPAPRCRAAIQCGKRPQIRAHANDAHAPVETSNRHVDTSALAQGDNCLPHIPRPERYRHRSRHNLLRFFERHAVVDDDRAVRIEARECIVHITQHLPELVLALDEHEVETVALALRALAVSL